MSLLPGSEVDEGDGDGVTGHQRVAANQIGQLSGIAAWKWVENGIGTIMSKCVGHILEEVLKARGCILLMLSPLSQVTWLTTYIIHRLGQKLFQS